VQISASDAAVPGPAVDLLTSGARAVSSPLSAPWRLHTVRCAAQEPAALSATHARSVALWAHSEDLAKSQGGCAFSIYIWGQRTESDAQSLHMIGRDTVRTDGWYSTLTNAVHYLISICRNFRSCPLTVILPYKRQSIGPVTICGWLQRMQRR